MVSVPTDGFTVLLILETRGEDARTLAEALAGFAADHHARHPGFICARIHTDEDQRHVVVMLQWERAEHWTAYRASPDGQEGLSRARDRVPRVLYLESPRIVTAAPRTEGDPAARD